MEKFFAYKNVNHRYFPLDVNFLIKSFLNKWKPNLVIFIDSEIWPNLILIPIDIDYLLWRILCKNVVVF